MITKKQIKQIKKGNHAVLMECLDFLLDSYDDDKFDLGYNSCVADMSVHTQRLAVIIKKWLYEIGDCKLEDLAKVIEDYFKTIKQ